MILKDEKEDFADELKSVVEVYIADFNKSNLQIQLHTLSTNITDTVQDVRRYIQMTAAELVLNVRW